MCIGINISVLGHHPTHVITFVQACMQGAGVLKNNFGVCVIGCNGIRGSPGIHGRGRPLPGGLEAIGWLYSRHIAPI